jgi:hypothetical protein
VSILVLRSKVSNLSINSSIAASLLGVLLGYYLKSDPGNNVNVKVDSPKYYGVDTIYLLNQTAKVDTSLVGLVNVNAKK